MNWTGIVGLYIFFSGNFDLILKFFISMLLFDEKPGNYGSKYFNLHGDFFFNQDFIFRGSSLCDEF